jgi:hypothetical protein
MPFPPRVMLFAKSQRRPRHVEIDPPTPPTPSSRVNLGSSETAWNWSSKGHRGLEAEWQYPATYEEVTPVNTPGGTWLDQSGNLNGTNYFYEASLAAGSTSLTLDISAVGGDIYITGIPPGSATGVWTVTIDGEPLQITSTNLIDGVATFPDAFWISAGSTTGNFDLGPQTLRNQSPYTNPSGNGSGVTNSGIAIIIKNPNLGSSLAMSWTIGTTITRTVRMMRAIGPVIKEYPMGDPPVGAAEPDIYDYEPTSIGDLEAFVPPERGTIDFSSNSNGSFGIDPDNNLKYVRIRIPTTNRKGISWFKEITPERDEGYFQYCLYIEDSAYDGVHPNDAVKLPGPSQEASWLPNVWNWSWRLHHGGKSRNNPYVFSFENYRYYGTQTGGFGQSDLKNEFLRTGRWYLMDIYIKMNTHQPDGTANEDGEGRAWINRNLVYEATDIGWLKDTFHPNYVNRRVMCMWYNIFMGGNNYFPVADMYYRMARLRASSQPIAIPPELVTSDFPAWRVPMTNGVLTTIPNTIPSPPASTTSAPVHWHMYAIGQTGRVYGGMGSGHNSDSTQKGLQSVRGVHSIDLREDEPHWTTLHAGTSTTSNIPNYTEIQAWYDSKPYRAHYPADPGGVPIRPPYQAYYGMYEALGANCNDGNDRLFFVEMKSPRGAVGGANSRRQVDGFNLAINEWDNPIDDTVVYPYTGVGTQWGDIPVKNGNEFPEPAGCWDRRTGKFYRGAGYNLDIFDPFQPSNHWTSGITTPQSNGLFTFSGAQWNGYQGRGMCIDTLRDRIVTIQSTSATECRIEWFPLAGGALSFINVSGIVNSPQAGPRVVSGGVENVINFGNGLAYDEDNDRYVILLSPPLSNGRDEWYGVHPTTGVATLIATMEPGSWGRIQGAFGYVADLGCIISIPYATSNIVVLPTRQSA